MTNLRDLTSDQRDQFRQMCEHTEPIGGTQKFWDEFTIRCIEAIEHGCGVTLTRRWSVCGDALIAVDATVPASEVRPVMLP